jgi:PEP-CTERM motif-containing protein
MHYKKLVALVLVALLGAPLTATAIPITYQIKFTTLTGSVRTSTFLDPTDEVEDAAGNVYFGLFAVDDSILLTDGIGKAGILDFFFIQMEDNIWGYNLASNNSFVGFRGPLPGVPSPGFDVVNGALTNLRGGVFGIADFPLVDFSRLAPNTFNATGATVFSQPGTSFSRVVDITGTMEISRVPEPGTLSLLGLGFLVLGFSTRRAAQ